MRILVAVDGSAHAGRAVGFCADLASRLGAEVVAVHALEEPVSPVPTMAYVSVPPLDERARAELRRILAEEWCAPLAAAGVAWRARLEDGTPAAVVLRVADEEAADLVVVGRRGRGGFSELVLGSTSHQLSHHSTRPLVIVP